MNTGYTLDKAYIDYINGRYEVFTYSEGNRIELGRGTDLIKLKNKFEKKNYEVVLIKEAK